MDSETAITIKTFPDQTSADLAGAELKRAGIDYMLVADDAGGMLPSLQLVGGIKLLVDPSDEDGAKAVLEDLSTVQSPNSVEDSSGSTPARSSSGFWTGLAVGIILGIAGVLAYREISWLRTDADEYDRNNDGRPDEVFHYEKGRLVRRTLDRNFDGRVDVWDYFHAALYERTEEDNNFDGKGDSWGVYKFGQYAAWQYDTDFNGQHDFTSTFRDGIVEQADWKPNGSKIVTVRNLFKHGVLTDEFRDLNTDGQFDVQIKFDSFYQPVATNYLDTR